MCKVQVGRWVAEKMKNRVPLRGNFFVISSGYCIMPLHHEDHLQEKMTPFLKKSKSRQICVTLRTNRLILLVSGIIDQLPRFVFPIEK